VSYPQPNADQYALNGYKFFRLNTPLISDGDMYESQQGAQGFAIGPDSDISKVNIGYFDDQVPRFLNQVAITPERAFPGFIAARNDTNYVPANRPGRILIWSDELYNPTWSPSFIDIAGRIDFEVPVMDVVQYFAPAAQAMNQGRNDKEYWYDFIPAPPSTFGSPNTWVLVIPFYGRRFFTMNFKSDETVQVADIDVSISGLHYKPGTNNTAATVMPLINKDGGANFPKVTVPPNTLFNCVIRASDNSLGGAKWNVGNNPTVSTFQITSGMFDALAIQFFASSPGILSAAQNTCRIRTSDRENG